MDAARNGYVPIISTVAGGANGEVFNINADVAAARIAAKLDADVYKRQTGLWRKANHPCFEQVRFGSDAA